MNKLSVVIITFNEEKNIERCLLSVKDIADEIVVVDSLSTDSTKSICQKFGVRFTEQPFLGYIEQKNFAASLATFDLVLSLDADEALDETLANTIAGVKINWDKDGYFMNRVTNYCGKWIRHGAWYPDKKLRLWNRTKGAWAGVNIHEWLQMTPGSKTGHLKGDILHYSYESIEAHVAQFNKFTSLSAVEMNKSGIKATIGKIYLNSLVNFLKGFFLRLGFLDGYYGTMICFFNAFATYTKYLKLRQLNKGLRI
jgi:glycosyltransferase involved in cell wall biosynthesis